MEKYSLHAARASRMENVYPAARIKRIACAGRIRIQRVSWHKAGPEHSQNDQTAAPKSQGQNRLQGTWPEVQARRKQRSESSLYGIRRQTAAVIGTVGFATVTGEDTVRFSFHLAEAHPTSHICARQPEPLRLSLTSATFASAVRGT